MTEPQKTLTYVVVAAVMAVAGVFLAPHGPQAAQDGLEALIGTAFYKDFKNPAEATAIEVIGYDPATATAKPFRVEYKDGLWRIPTHFGYPADAKDRLAKVSASIIGLKREALAGRSETEQADFQVLDPKSEKADNLKGIGNRLTLKNGDTVLADYIIGKQVPSRPGYYYVRKPDEKQTFIAKVELNLSTKFTDWIESDVLNLDGNKLSQIDIMKHSLEIKQQRARLVGQEQNILTRKNSSDPWQLQGLDEAAEEVNQDEVRKVVTALDDLKIIAVRPKPTALRKGLQANEGITLDSETEDDLASRGFFFLPTKSGVQMISMEGDLTAGTEQGVEYEMHFGNVFEATEKEIELGFTQPAADAAKSEDGEQKDDAISDEKAGLKKKSRFIFVTARVNPALFGPEPEEPIKPEPPSEEPAEEKSDTPKAEPPEKKSGDEKPGESKPDDQKSEDKPSDEAQAEEQPAEPASAEDKPADPAETPPEPPKVDPKKAYEDALKKYAADKLKYAADLKAREDKVKDAEEKIKVLNARFADWYYVISSESFENLRPGRDALVKAKAGTEPMPEDDQPKDPAAPSEPESEPGSAKEESKPNPDESPESPKQPE